MVDLHCLGTLETPGGSLQVARVALNMYIRVWKQSSTRAIYNGSYRRSLVAFNVVVQDHRGIMFRMLASMDQ